METLAANNILSQKHIIEDDVSNPLPPLLILTEEYPQNETVRFICGQLGVVLSPIPYVLNLHDNTWDGTFNLIDDTGRVCGKMMLVKGNGSFVDYLVFDTYTPSHDTQPILAVEATKVRDGDSRNCAVYQRLTKLRCIKKQYPGLSTDKIIVRYERPFIIKTSTVRFGIRLLLTMGFGAYDTDGDITTKVSPFKDLDELIHEKNSIAKPTSGVPVRIKRTEYDTIHISAKLSKGRNTKISHDPNIGLVTGLIGAIITLDPMIKHVEITDHHVDLDSIARSNAKFWYANSEIDMRLEGSSMSSLGKTPPSTEYWSKADICEKASTILFHSLIDNKDMEVIFANHASSARSSLKTLDGSYIDLTKKHRIPDIVLRNKSSLHITVVEGKDFAHIKDGEAQLDDQEPFITELQKYYPDHTFDRALCLAVKTLASIPETRYPVVFAIDNTGSYELRI